MFFLLQQSFFLIDICGVSYILWCVQLADISYRLPSVTLMLLRNESSLTSCQICLCSWSTLIPCDVLVPMFLWLFRSFRSWACAVMSLWPLMIGLCCQKTSFEFLMRVHILYLFSGFIIIDVSSPGCRCISKHFHSIP